jgi:hypothetical protein
MIEPILRNPVGHSASVHCERHRNHHCVLAMLAAPLLLRLALLGETKMMTSDIPTEKKIGVQLG